MKRSNDARLNTLETAPQRINATLSRRKFIGTAVSGTVGSYLVLNTPAEIKAMVSAALPLLSSDKPAGRYQPTGTDPGARLVADLYRQRRGSGRVVPDTLDLQDNATLAVWAVTSGLDPTAEYRIAVAIYFDRRPLCMRHIPSDFTQMPKYAEALVLLRSMTGSRLNESLDARIWETIERHTKQNGLLYVDTAKSVATPDGAYTDARVLNARICKYELKPTVLLEEQIERAIGTMVERRMTRGFGFGPLLPACKWHRLTGSKKALELAKLDWEALDRGKVFGNDGSFGGHFHYHSGAAIGLLAYALMAQDEALLQKICRVYEFARSKGTDYGYFPEALAPAPWVMQISNEGCCTADMISLAAALSRSGTRDCWDDMDLYLRNQLTEMQMKRTDFVDRIPDENKIHLPIRPEHGETKLDDLTRFIGSFAGWAAPNDFAGPAHFWLQQCCLGNGPRGLYQGWENIVTSQGSGVRVNLLLNRFTPEIEVDSFLPYDGKVEIQIKKRIRLEVRIPGWVDLTSVRADVAGNLIKTRQNGRYVEFPVLDPGVVARVSFPMKEREAAYWIPGAPWASRYSIVEEDSGSGMPLPRSVAKTPPEIVKKILEPVKYRVNYRGSTVVSIEPTGSIYPLYQRGEMVKQERAPFENVKRHIPEKLIDNWM